LTHFRPCYGQFNPLTINVLRRLGYTGVLWSLIAYDWLEQSEVDLWHGIRSKLHDGAIIVLHDGHATTPTMIRTLARLAEDVARRGWTFVPLLPAAHKIPVTRQ
jgi:peptidoglycan-N-acetylglucosamine deacetylase